MQVDLAPPIVADGARIQHYLQQCNILPDSEYIKQLYIKNYNWHPPPAPPIIEDSLCAFENALKERKEKQLRCKNSTRANPNNLTTPQLNTLRALRQNKGLIIKPTDKNLGPAVMETSQYIKQVLQEHLLSKDYQELTQQEAIQKLGQVKSTLKGILTTNANQLSKAENTFSKRASQPSTESPYFMASQKCTRHHSHYDR